MIEPDLKFDHCVLSISKEAIKNWMLWQTSTIIWLCKKEELYVAKKVFDSQFTYRQLIWIFTSSKVDPRKDYLHEGMLMSACKEDNLSFDELLKKDSSFSTCYTNTYFLAVQLDEVIQSIQSDEQWNFQYTK